MIVIVNGTKAKSGLDGYMGRNCTGKERLMRPFVGYLSLLNVGAAGR